MTGTPNLNITELTPNQTTKTVDINNGFVKLDGATQGQFAPAFTSNARTLTGDEFTGSYFVGAPNVNMLPLQLYTAGSGGNYQVASITALLLLIPSLLFMALVERFLKADVLSRVGH